MGDISPRFSRHEFACKDGCGFDTVDVELVNNLESLADNFLEREQDHTNPEKNAQNVIVHITSGNRCVAYNREVKMREAANASIRYVEDKKPSEHSRSAADFWMEYSYPGGLRRRISDNDVADELELIYVARHGIGRYKGRTHYDVRSNGPARWDKR